jgi:hypothetical protein
MHWASEAKVPRHCPRTFHPQTVYITDYFSTHQWFNRPYMFQLLRPSSVVQTLICSSITHLPTEPNIKSLHNDDGPIEAECTWSTEPLLCGPAVGNIWYSMKDLNILFTFRFILSNVHHQMSVSFLHILHTQSFCSLPFHPVMLLFNSFMPIL